MGHPQADGAGGAAGGASLLAGGVGHGLLVLDLYRFGRAMWGGTGGEISYIMIILNRHFYKYCISKIQTISENLHE